MRVGRLMLPAAVVLGLALAPAEASAETDACVDEYLLCINDASQQDGWFYRTAREAECGMDYYSCVRRRLSAS